MADNFIFTPTRVEWDERHADLFQDFITRLEQRNIRYVVMKNDEGLPYINHAKDVDILIEPGQYALAAELLRQSYKEHNISHIKVHRFERLRCWYGFCPAKHFAIHIDLLEGFLHKGCELFSFDTLYQHVRQNEHGICVLDHIFAAVVLLLHSTICYHSIKDKYVSLIAKAYAQHKADMDSIFVETFPESVAKQLIAWLEEEKYSTIAEHGRWFSHQSKRIAFLKRPWTTGLNIASFLWEKVERLILNRDKYNTFFSVHAPDGTGKTTFIQSIAECLAFYFVCEAKDLVQINHFRPSTLPNLGAAGEKMRIMKQDTNFTDPHRSKPASLWGSLLRMGYYWLDYLIGTPWILRKNAQFSKVTIFDRYVYDFLVDPRRSRIALPYWLRRCFASLIKQPKVVFILDADSETIYQRKQELTKGEITRQLSAFKSLAKTLGKRAHIIDATQAPEAMAAEAITILLDRFATKL